MADVFLSYSHDSRELTQSLAEELQKLGPSVWWDSSLLSGDTFRDAIYRELDAAKAAIVIWSPSSIKSDWVISEATRARAQGKLIPLRSPEVGLSDIPPPFGVLHTDKLEDRDRIYAALRKFGLIAKQPGKPARARPAPPATSKPLASETTPPATSGIAPSPTPMLQVATVTAPTTTVTAPPATASPPAAAAAPASSRIPETSKRHIPWKWFGAASGVLVIAAATAFFVQKRAACSSGAWKAVLAVPGLNPLLDFKAQCGDDYGFIASELSRRDGDEFKQASEADTIASLEAYLNALPKGLHADEARKAIERRRREEAEQATRDFANAKRIGSIASYQRYLDTWPGDFSGTCGRSQKRHSQAARRRKKRG